MILENYQIKLKRVEFEDLEYIRIARNSDFVRKNMIYQKIISKKEQQEWFKKINNPENFYFVIIHKSEKVGLINLKDVNMENKSAEGGIFLFSREFASNDISMRASIMLTDFGFYELNLKKILNRVRKDNILAIRFNKAIGYSFHELDSNVLVGELFLDEYEKFASRYRNLFNKLYNLTN
ncbi:MAG: GNAT family N-acetyltransferase [Cytophagales bacterium]|nr:GNAT family N-acetyltransferase [Cytophagales bacterium]